MAIQTANANANANANAKPDIDFDILIVGNMAMNSRGPEPATGQLQSSANGRYSEDHLPGGLRAAFRMTG